MRLRFSSVINLDNGTFTGIHGRIGIVVQPYEHTGKVPGFDDDVCVVSQVQRRHRPRSEAYHSRTLAVQHIHAARSIIKGDVLVNEHKIVVQHFPVEVLFDAWKRGEDGAEAFKKKASEIVGTVLNNIFRLKVLEPMMQKLADDLFGKDGEGGIFGKDFELTSDEVMNYVVDSLMNIGDSWNDYAKFMDEANERYREKTGESLKDEESKSGLSAGIQSVTEDTADLLASYLNAIRADVSEQTHVLWPRLLDDVLPQMNVIAESQLRVQTQIAENTMRNAVAAEAIVKSNDEINRLLARVTQGGAKFYIH